MKKLVIIPVLLILASCGSSSGTKTATKPLYEVLTQQSTGGASIRFYEILTEQKEIRMLLGDDNLRKKIGPGDITSANFIILNMGEKPSAGYSITVDEVVETSDKIIVTVKEKEPSSDSMSASVMTNPYTIVKINSKKPIEIK
ncbi:MAG TPA: protease complex subunit PrcB family protein [Flavobacterium sp.]|jgi:hypothetical protein